MSLRIACLGLAAIAVSALGACTEREFPVAEAAKTPPCAQPQLPAADVDDQIPGFGCATEANLRAMMVNPADLDAGAAATAAPAGDAAIAAATRHRLGQVKTGGDAGPQAPTFTIRREGD